MMLLPILLLFPLMVPINSSNTYNDNFTSSSWLRGRASEDNGLGVESFTDGKNEGADSLLEGGSNSSSNTSSVDKRRRTASAVPELVGRWKRFQDFPEDVGESQGALVGCDLLNVGGFYPSFGNGPRITYAYDLCNPDTATWRELAIHPIEKFLTHAAHADKGDNLFYLCGGYRGTNRGPSISDCHVFNKNDGPIGSWRALPRLPARRGGGGMVYIEEQNKLLFTLGALRERLVWPAVTPGLDKNNTWSLDLGGVNLMNPTAGAQWVSRPGGSPYLGNHVTSIVAKDCSGKSRYFFLGGQVGEEETTNNIEDVWEYIPSNDKFVKRASMPEPRGHFTTSIAPYGCGFITVCGSKNQRPVSSDEVLYYDIDSNEWTQIGRYPIKTRTPVCGIVSDVMYCTTGYTVDSWKIQLKFPTSTTPSPPTSSPPPPTSSPPPSVIMKYDFIEINNFVYRDNMFRGARNANNAGGWWGNGVLGVWLGGEWGKVVAHKMSGGHETSFTLDADASIKLRLTYRVQFLSMFESQENTQVLCAVDGKGRNVEVFKGSNSPTTTDWKMVDIDLGVHEAGEHTFAIGGFLTKRDEAAETVRIMFRYVSMTAEYP